MNYKYLFFILGLTIIADDKNGKIELNKGLKLEVPSLLKLKLPSLFNQKSNSSPDYGLDYGLIAMAKLGLINQQYIKKYFKPEIQNLEANPQALEVELEPLDDFFIPSFTRHKLQLNLSKPEDQDFYDELLNLTSLGLRLPISTVNLKEGEKIFTLDFNDKNGEDQFINELKYYQKLAKIRKANFNAPLPKKYQEVAQDFIADQLAQALQSYYKIYELEVNDYIQLKTQKTKLRYEILKSEISELLKKSLSQLTDYLQLANDFVNQDYQPTAEISQQMAKILANLQSENHLIKSKLSDISNYLQENKFNEQLIIIMKQLQSELENFRRILISKKSFQALLQDQDLDLTFEDDFQKFKKLFNEKAVSYHDQRFQ